MTTIHVTNISPQTTEADVSNFFSFCGKISSISVTPLASTQSATITFERASAAKTAILLDGTPLHNSPLSVTAAQSLDDLASSSPVEDIPQEDKPRAAIFAEYLSHGYAIADAALQKGIEFDKQQNLSTKFQNALHNILEKTHATERAQAVDQQLHLQEKAEGARNLFMRYFEKALDTAPGQRVRKFYTDAEKQVFEIHEEAKRLKELRAKKGNCTCEKVGDDGSCKCAPESCTCSGCNNSNAVEEAEDKAGPTGQFQHAVRDVKDAVADAKA